MTRHDLIRACQRGIHAAVIVGSVKSVALTSQVASTRHVRGNEPRILSLIAVGLSRSATFRRLVETLNGSDVIVYVDPKQTRQALGGYLAHNIVSRGGYRYLHIAVDTHGSDRRLVPLLAHELQHAVEVSQHPDALDENSLERLFSRLAITFGCGVTACSETQAAKDVEEAVGEELKAVR